MLNSFIDVEKPTSRKKILPIEARHSICLEIAKKKRQKFATSIFLPKEHARRLQTSKMSQHREKFPSNCVELNANGNVQRNKRCSSTSGRHEAISRKRRNHCTSNVSPQERKHLICLASEPTLLHPESFPVMRESITNQEIRSKLKSLRNNYHMPSLEQEPEVHFQMETEETLVCDAALNPNRHKVEHLVQDPEISVQDKDRETLGFCSTSGQEYEMYHDDFIKDEIHIDESNEKLQSPSYVQPEVVGFSIKPEPVTNIPTPHDVHENGQSLMYYSSSKNDSTAEALPNPSAQLATNLSICRTDEPPLTKVMAHYLVPVTEYTKSKKSLFPRHMQNISGSLPFPVIDVDEWSHNVPEHNSSDVHDRNVSYAQNNNYVTMREYPSYPQLMHIQHTDWHLPVLAQTSNGSCKVDCYSATPQPVYRQQSHTPTTTVHWRQNNLDIQSYQRVITTVQNHSYVHTNHGLPAHQGYHSIPEIKAIPTMNSNYFNRDLYHSAQQAIHLGPDPNACHLSRCGYVAREEEISPLNFAQKQLQSILTHPQAATCNTASQNVTSSQTLASHPTISVVPLSALQQQPTTHQWIYNQQIPAITRQTEVNPLFQHTVESSINRWKSYQRGSHVYNPINLTMQQHNQCHLPNLMQHHMEKYIHSVPTPCYRKPFLSSTSPHTPNIFNPQYPRATPHSSPAVTINQLCHQPNFNNTLCANSFL